MQRQIEDSINNSSGPGTGILTGIFPLYGFLILLALASFVFWVVEIIDVARRQWPESNTKTIWLLVVVLGHGLGALV